ncbi:hypothetical protein [Haloprofundus salinisoli]|uniref:hypothetical protein n=1 Tax=Haloprofundus salinisoli TaxID=2876193 RepID=UPI001CCF59E7|nr:hypothetical protein [Haloprofundus salinisoli]
MWGPKPVDGFTVVVCWIRGHKWSGDSVTSAERNRSAANSDPDENGEYADLYRCERCNRMREQAATDLVD